MILSYKTHEQDAGKTVDTLLRYELKLSASMIRRLKNVQGICADGRKVYTIYKPQPGETVTADLSLAEPPCDIVPEEGDFEILFENDGLLAVNKPAGMIIHPSHSRYGGTLANFVAGYLLKTTGDGRCHSVNRLDRDTSGAVLFSKNSYMKDRASAALGDESAQKEYLALVYGRIPEDSGTIALPIRRLQEMELRRIVSPDGQRAVTHYKTEKTAVLCGKEISLLRLRLETGRTHQIRVHCHALGCPLLGDILYHTPESQALSEALGITKQALHAERLCFTEPLSNAPLSLTAPIIREDMKKILELF